MTTQNYTKLFTNQWLNDAAKTVHKANEKWWIDLETGKKINRPTKRLFLLMISEVTEAMEGVRKNLLDPHIPQFMNVDIEMADLLIRLLDFVGGNGLRIYIDYNLEGYQVKDVSLDKSEALFNICHELITVGAYINKFGVEDTDNMLSGMIQVTIITAESFGCDLMGAYEAKMRYNAEREDHKIENRAKEGGKKW